MYSTAPTLRLVRNLRIVEIKEALPDICKHGREHMIGNEFPSVLSKISKSEQ